MNAAEYVYLNGWIMPRDEARISPFDRGFLYGDGLFETTRIMRGAALFLERHLQRLAASCREMGFGGAPDMAQLAGAVRRLIDANGVGEGYLRITVSRGPHAGDLTALTAADPTVLIQATAMDLPPLDRPADWALIRSAHRVNERSPVARHKSLSYQANLLILAEARQAGADEAYSLNTSGYLAEGTISNLFFVRGGTVCTPDVECGVLPGITREVVLELCQRLSIPTEVGEFREEALRDADEAFCTNSLRGVVRVSRFLNWPEKAMRRDGVARQLRDAYARVACEYCGGQGV